MASITINFTGNKAVYAPGEMISGQVNISTVSELDVKAVDVKFSGKGYVHWSETHSNGKSTYTQHFYGREQYFKDKLVVFGGNGATLPAGENIFPFQYQLPPNLPSSFETRNGHVRYSIKCKIRRSGVFSNYKYLCCYTILDNLDLNEEPNMLQPAGISDSKMLCCLCCADGPIEAEVSTDRSGYVPGEFITLNGNIENMSSTDIPTLRISLLQVITLHATSKSRKMEEFHATKEIPGCRRRSSVQLSKERIQIPALPPSHLRFCKVIDIQYYVQVCVVIPGPHINLRVNCPITIGSIPLQGVAPYGFAPPQAPEVPLHPQLPGEVPSYDTEQVAAPQLPLPTYEAATAYRVRKPNDKGITSGQETFAPQYAYYDWSQSAFSYN